MTGGVRTSGGGRRGRYALIGAAAGALLCAVGVLRSWLYESFFAPPGTASIVRLVVDQAAQWAVLIAIVPPIVLFCERWPVRSRRDFARLGLHAAALPVFHAMLSVGTRALIAVVGRPSLPPFHLGRALFRVDPMFTVVLYASIASILHVVRREQLLREVAMEQMRLRERVALLRVESLQRQLEPHFLFNALTTIASLITREPVLARRLVTRLGGLLRRALGAETRALVPLSDEVSFLRDYLALQEARFRDALRASVTVEARAEEARVPWMLLQPLVENAITHGMSADGVCRVAVLARVDGGRLELSVTDDGAGFATLRGARPTTGAAGAGFGLRGTRERLAALFGDGAELRLENPPGGGARVTVSLPAGTGDAAASVLPCETFSPGRAG
ncbi:histidine kinase internal region (plasmid) [Gemmatirosa kalamazoonensis]|uniref:histidine kinase n=1 Tax=Gemmatirosa kalamazoonensis TaxID=861299 RepID=W0RS70_9BACT|nr:histidine kinase [Gemmatirosa kalamazoonensis]AHG93297.1 histidine kinase internal region [Gemmatirosa kalamazoonensis]